MDKTEEELRERAREALAHRIRPQDEVMAVKRIMAHHLAQSLGTEHLSSPLSLVGADTAVTPSDKLQGTQRDYVEAVQRNLQAREEFAKLQSELAAAAAPPPPNPSEDEDPETELLELQLEVNRLEQERDRLKVVNKHLDVLATQPAASPDYLKPEVMFKGCKPLPELPKELMDGFTRDVDGDGNGGARGKGEVQELVSRLQKAVLRNKLLAKREKQKLEDLQARQPIDPTALSSEAQLHALNAVKDHLISWIENMLSKAGDDEGEESLLGGESPSKPRQREGAPPGEKVNHAAQVAEIQKEYERHVELRKQIMASMAQLKQLQEQRPLDEKTKKPRQKKQKSGSEEEPASSTTAEPTAYLLTPYLERLQAISREQKGLMQEKSHIKTTLARQQQTTTKILDHLAEESQLLAKYPATPHHAAGDQPADSGPGRPHHTSSSGAKKSRISFGEATRAASSSSAAAATRSNVTAQVEPWLFAADSAKIATLEAVAEKVDEGQMAVDEAMRSLAEVRKLLNRGDEEEEGNENGEGKGPGEPEEGGAAEDDLWLAGDDNDNGSGKAVAPGRKNTEKKPDKAERKSIWSRLDGNLGLINE